MSVGAPLECIGVDITCPHPLSSNGYRYILTIVDHFSRWAEAYPIRNQEAVTVARVLVNEFISRFGCPRQVITDQGPCFEATLFKELCRRLQIDKTRTTPYKPSTNGAVERFNRTLNSMLGKVVAVHQRDWDVHLPFVPAAYRASENESTGFTPNQLFLSRELCMPIDLVLGDCLVLPDRLCSDEYVLKPVQRIQDDFSVARTFMQRLATIRADRYDLRVRPVSFEPGDLVWYFYPRKRSGLKEKWTRFYTGPYRVLERLSSVLYRIRRSPRSQPQVVYVDKLKRFEGEDPVSQEVNEESEVLGLEFLENPDLDVSEQVSSPISRPKRKIVKPVRYQ